MQRVRGKYTSVAAAIRRFLTSPLCWWVVLGLFTVEALWFVFSARFPMAFDESYHLGLIKLHAQQWSPFFTHQPAGTSIYGAIARDPSYLYHWLMSFPYRVLTHLTANQTAQIIVLRILNVGIFLTGLVLTRRIVRRLGASPTLTNSLFLAFILIPVVPFLAATINYDNLFFVTIAVTILLTLKLSKSFERNKVEAGPLLWLVIVILLASLVKYPYLPVAAVTSLYLFVRLWRSGLLSKVGWRSFSGTFNALAVWRRILLVVLCLVAFGLFAERYGTNLARYHNPVPKCDAILTQQDCSQYGPYGRDLLYKQTKPATFHPNVAVYGWEWLWGMWYRLYFAVSDTYATAPPLLLLAWFGVASALFLLCGILLRLRWLFRDNRARQFVLYATLGYIGVLFVDGFSAYAKTGQPVAINGRYLIPFLPFLLAYGGIAWAHILQRRPNVEVLLATIVLVVMLLQGGGTMTFIMRSSDDWFWQNTTVITVNRTVRSIAWPFILGRGNY